MTVPMQGADSARLRRQGAEHAIELALESKWEEAAKLNDELTKANPSDVDAWNRLGKSLLELGRFRDARAAYQHSIKLDPVNTIAKRNIDRLASLDIDEPRRPEATAKVAQDLFIEEMGKSGTTALRDVPPELIAKMVAGDEVYLKPDGHLLNVEDIQGQRLGAVEPKLGLRLLRLMQGGNRYAAAVKSVSESAAQLIIKETFRDPSQTKLSFPAVGEGVRPYIKESLLRYDLDDEEEEPDEDADNEDWDSEPESEGTVSLSTLKETIEGHDDDDED
jgi:hypothetical protein